MWGQPFVIPAGIFLVLTLPLILGRIPPNRGYGIRTPATLADPQSWYRANRVGGAALCIEIKCPTHEKTRDHAKPGIKLIMNHAHLSHAFGQ